MADLHREPVAHAGVTPTANLTVAYATADGTATAGMDYTSSSGTLTFTQASAGAQTWSRWTTHPGHPGR